jgi:type I restriction enzyme S subunit
LAGFEFHYLQSQSKMKFSPEITLLREYQTRLTADVVTGKLDVREAARRLPEDGGEPAEPEAADGEETLEESSLVEYAAERCRVG